MIEIEKNKDLFSKCIQIAEDKSVSVIELPDKSLRIEGTRGNPYTIDEDRPVIVRAINFSPEAAMCLCSILVEWKEQEPDAPT